jgi:hypothetical protein
MNARKAVTYCRNRGSPLEQYRIRFLADGRRDDAEAAGLLEALESPGGGFPYNLKPGNPACLSETAAQLSTMLDLGLRETPVTSRTYDFLLAHQWDDGGWDENPELLSLDPPPWDRPHELNTRTWLSGEIIRQLAHASVGESEKLKHGCGFLMSHFDGIRIKGYQIGNAIGLAAISLISPEEARHLGLLLSTVRDWTAAENDPAFLNWYLECYMDCGLTRQDPSVAECMGKLEGLQHPDGFWGGGDSPQYAINTTINALKHLKWAGRW